MYIETLNKVTMQSEIQISFMAINGEVDPHSIQVDYRQALPLNQEVNPRLGFALPFLKELVKNKYPVLHPGDRFKEETLLFEFVIESVNIQPELNRPFDKQIIVTGLLVG